MAREKRRLSERQARAAASSPAGGASASPRVARKLSLKGKEKRPPKEKPGYVNLKVHEDPDQELDQDATVTAFTNPGSPGMLYLAVKARVLEDLPEDPKDLIGRQVARLFLPPGADIARWYLGVVTSVAKGRGSKQGHSFRVTYDEDGDVEDLDWRDLQDALLPLGGKRG